MATSVGNLLKQKREELNLSLSDVEGQTKLKEYLLLAIEEDRFDEVGEAGYVKILIVTYARAINANEELILNLLSKRSDKSIVTSLKITTKKTKKKKLLISPVSFYFLLLFILIGALGYVVYKLYQNEALSFESLRSQFVQEERHERGVYTATSTSLDELTQSHFLARDNLITDIHSIARESEAQKILTIEKSRLIRRILEDPNDYVSEFIFNHRESPLNADLNIKLRIQPE